MENDVCPTPGRLDVFFQIGQVDIFPGVLGDGQNLIKGHLGKAVVVVIWVFFSQLEQGLETLQVPGFNIGDICIDIDGKVKIITDV